MEKKYEILKDTKERFLGREVYRIRALKNFSDVKKGDIGGFVGSEKNLSQQGDCWIYDKAVAYDCSEVCDNAIVKYYVIVGGNAIVGSNAKIKDKNQWFVVENVGSRKDNITFYETDGVIYVNVGCFNGTLDEFIERVKTTHKGNNFEKEYLQIAELAKIKLGGLNE